MSERVFGHGNGSSKARAISEAAVSCRAQSASARGVMVTGWRL